jgi:hypothetical protein
MGFIDEHPEIFINAEAGNIRPSVFNGSDNDAPSSNGGGVSLKELKRQKGTMAKISASVRSMWRSMIATPPETGEKPAKGFKDLVNQVSTADRGQHLEKVGKAQAKRKTQVEKIQTQELLNAPEGPMNLLYGTVGTASAMGGDVTHMLSKVTEATAARTFGDIKKANRIVKELETEPDYASARGLTVGDVWRSHWFDTYHPEWGNVMVKARFYTEDMKSSIDHTVPLSQFEALKDTENKRGYYLSSSARPSYIKPKKMIPEWVPMVGGATRTDVGAFTAEMLDPVSNGLLMGAGAALKPVTSPMIAVSKELAAAGVSKATETKLARWAAETTLGKATNKTVNAALDKLESSRNTGLGLTLRANTRRVRDAMYTPLLGRRAAEAEMKFSRDMYLSALSGTNRELIDDANILLRASNNGEDLFTSQNGSVKRALRTFMATNTVNPETDLMDMVQTVVKMSDRRKSITKQIGSKAAKKFFEDEQKIAYALADMDAGMSVMTGDLQAIHKMDILDQELNSQTVAKELKIEEAEAKKLLERYYEKDFVISANAKKAEIIEKEMEKIKLLGETAKDANLEKEAWTAAKQIVRSRMGSEQNKLIQADIMNAVTENAELGRIEKQLADKHLDKARRKELEKRAKQIHSDIVAKTNEKYRMELGADELEDGMLQTRLFDEKSGKLVKSKGPIKATNERIQTFVDAVEKETKKLLDGDLTEAELKDRAKILAKRSMVEASPENVALPDRKVMYNGREMTYEQLRAQYQRIAKKAGVNDIAISDLQSIFDALALQGEGMGIGSANPAANKLINKFGDLLYDELDESDNILGIGLHHPTQEDLSRALGEAPALELLNDKLKVKLLTGANIIHELVDNGLISVEAEEYLRNALRASVGRNMKDDIDKFLEMYLSVDDVVRQKAYRNLTGMTLDPTQELSMANNRIRKMVDKVGEIDVATRNANLPGAGADLATVKQALAAQEAIEKYAASQGFDVETLRDMVRFSRNLDEMYGKLLVNMGQLSSEQFEKMKGMHVRHIYKAFPNLQDAIDKIPDAAKRSRLQAEYDRVLQGIDTLEDRGLRTSTIMAKQGQDVDVLGGGIELSGAKSRTQVDEEMRVLLDEVRNIHGSLDLSGARAARNISIGQTYRAMAANEFLASPIRTGFHPIQLRGKKWGALRGKYVSETVYGDLKRLTDQLRTRPEGMIKFWQKWIVRPYKVANVPLNMLRARRNNSLSNLLAIQSATGVTDAAEIGHYFSLMLDEIRNHGSEWRLMTRYSPSATTSSIFHHMIDEGLTGLSSETGNTIEDAAEWMLTRNFISKKLINSMEKEESYGKFMTYLIARDKFKMNPLEATLFAENTMIDYANVPPIVEWARRNGIFPFMTYSYKMAGNLVKWGMDKPTTFLKQLKALNNLQKNLMGSQIIQAEEPGVPDWMHIPMRIPGREPRYIDLANMLPHNIFMTTKKSETKADKLAAYMIENLGYPFKAVMETALGVNAGTGLPLYPEGSTKDERAKIAYKHLTTDNFSAIRILEKAYKSSQGKTGDEFGRGKPLGGWDVLYGYTNVDLPAEANMKYYRLQKQYQGLIKRANSVYTNKNLNGKQKEDFIAKHLAEANVVRDKMVDVVNKNVRMRGLTELIQASGAATEDDAKWLANYLTNQQPITPRDVEYLEDLGRTQELRHGVDLKKVRSELEMESLSEGSLPAEDAMKALNEGSNSPGLGKGRYLRPNQEVMGEAQQGMMQQQNAPGFNGPDREILPSIPWQPK